MRAIILAAGGGTRLGPAAAGRPKCLLDIGGRPLLETTLETLADAGIGDVTVVVGYEAAQVRAALGGRGTTIENPTWADTNSLYSLWCAREVLARGTLVLNGDTLVDPEILDRVLRAGPDALAYDSTSGSGREHMKVVLHDGCVAALGKDVPAGQASGENVGCFLLSAAAGAALATTAEALVTGPRRQAWVPEGLQAIAGQHRIRAVDVAGLPWGEIDFPFDLERARREVWPAIVRRRRRRPLRLAARLSVLAVVVASLAAAGWGLTRRGEAWATLPPEQGTRVRLGLAGDPAPQKWWRPEGGRHVRAEVEGPGRVRIELRLLCSPNAGPEGERYVTEVRIDGRATDWQVFRARKDPAATLDGAPVGDRDRMEVTVGPGKHVLEAGLIAEDPRTLLVRFRTPEVVE